MKFGFKEKGDVYYSLVRLLFAMYLTMIFMFVPLVFKIMSMFKNAYPDLYEMIVGKLIVFLVLYELFIGLRALTYYFKEIQGLEKFIMMDLSQISLYASELFIILVFNYINYKNNQNE